MIGKKTKNDNAFDSYHSTIAVADDTSTCQQPAITAEASYDSAENGTVDLSHYATEILSTEDHPLFDDAVKAGKAGILRAAYIMIWLACAESLKRRFREARKRDHVAAKIVGEIAKMEADHKAIDKCVLEEAKKYGFVSDSGYTILNQIYEMRCIYGHPYEEAPSREQVSQAAAMVVKHVLSKPVKLKQGFGDQLLDSLLENRNFLDDQQTAVEDFAKEILPKLDESIHGWLLEKYWSKLEKISGDTSMSVFFHRGIWFSHTILIEIGINVFSHDDWHKKTCTFPKVLMRVCGIADVFKEIGERAQDSLVGSIITEAATRARVLTILERLNNNDALTERQRERFFEHISEMELDAIRPSHLSMLTYYERLIDAMKSHDWRNQNPAIDLIVDNGPDQVAELDENQQVKLGRNLLQAGEGNAWSANNFLRNLSQDGTSWPFHVVRGIALESFTNEGNQIRFKDRHLDKVLLALEHLEPSQRKQLIADIAASVDAGAPKDDWLDRNKFASVVKSLKDYEWSTPLVDRLEAIPQSHFLQSHC